MATRTFQGITLVHIEGMKADGDPSPAKNAGSGFQKKARS
jgi:hypothetical protein